MCRIEYCIQCEFADYSTMRMNWSNGCISVGCARMPLDIKPSIKSIQKHQFLEYRISLEYELSSYSTNVMAIPYKGCTKLRRYFLPYVRHLHESNHSTTLHGYVNGFWCNFPLIPSCDSVIWHIGLYYIFWNKYAHILTELHSIYAPQSGKMWLYQVMILRKWPLNCWLKWPLNMLNSNFSSISMDIGVDLIKSAVTNRHST